MCPVNKDYAESGKNEEKGNCWGERGGEGGEEGKAWGGEEELWNQHTSTGPKMLAGVD